jgi:hypothetical protein
VTSIFLVFLSVSSANEGIKLKIGHHYFFILPFGLTYTVEKARFDLSLWPSQHVLQNDFLSKFDLEF